MKFIANEKFNIHSLSKLHRIKELHHNYIIKIIKEYHISFDNNKSEFVIKYIKIYSIFKDFSMIFLFI